MLAAERMSEEIIQICNAYAKHENVKLYEIVGVLELVKNDFVFESTELDAE